MKLQRQIDRLLAQRASEWHELLENATEEQRAEFVAWLKQSPLHVREYLEAVYTDQLLKHVEAERPEDVDSLFAQAAPPVVSLADAADTPLPSRKPNRWGRWMTRSLAAAVVLVLCASALVFGFKHYGVRPEYATSLGEQRTIQLPDASVVTLNADSRIQLHLDRARRDVELLRGEALFNVARDPHRPFTVQTETAVVRAVGTQFNVYERPNGTRISVLEGEVKVTALRKGHPVSGNIPGVTEDLGAGQEAQVALDGTIHRNAKADVLKTVAWRERHLVFDDAALEDMVYEFNRYSRTTRLVLDRVPPGSHHYSGIFDAADPDSLADLLSRDRDLIVERYDGEIVIRKR